MKVKNSNTVCLYFGSDYMASISHDYTLIYPCRPLQRKREYHSLLYRRTLASPRTYICMHNTGMFQISILIGWMARKIHIILTNIGVEIIISKVLNIVKIVRNKCSSYLVANACLHMMISIIPYLIIATTLVCKLEIFSRIIINIK